MSLLDAHPLFRPLASDLRARPGLTESDDGDPARAAVAIVLRAAPAVDESSVTGLELLLIQRAEREGDPWSGQVALPGGRRSAEDATLQDTAIRETREETGIDLAEHGHVLGTLDELRPRTPVLPPIIVTPFVFIAPVGLPIVISDELADAFWAPWSTFEDPARIDESTVHVRGNSWKVPSYLVGERIVWGMTERMLRQLSKRISRASSG